jgi:hypothetical protein
VANVPHTVYDVRHFYSIYGPQVAGMRSKTTNQHAQHQAMADALLKLQLRNQELIMDVMFVVHLKSLSMQVLDPVYNSTLICFGAKGLNLRKRLLTLTNHLVHCRERFQGWKLMCRVQETAWIRSIPRLGVVTGLPYHLPKDRIKDSVTYAISRTNLKSTSALNTNEYLRERFTGMKPDYKSELGLSFGDYIEAYNPKAEEKFNDVFTPRTEPCIALCLMANQNGLWMMYNFSSCTSILRSQWKKVPISQAVIEMLNDLARVTGVQPAKIIPDANTRNDEIMEDVQHEPIQVQFYLNH